MPPKSITPESTRIGWIGTGVMGRSMCEHILAAGYNTTVFNRSSYKADSLIASGASKGVSPGEIASKCDIIFTILGYPEDVRHAYLSDKGILNGCRPGTIVVDMTTSQPSLAQEIAKKAMSIGVAALDAPVSGGDIGAKNALLSIMVGGDAGAFATVEPLFKLLGTTIVHQGGPGRGQHTKMANQILIATKMIGVCESLLYARRAGLDLNLVLKSVASGAAGSWSLSNLAPKMIHGDFDPGFYVEHFIKDMKIALDEAAAMNLALPGLALARQLYLSVAAHGHSRSGTQALILALAELNNVEWKQI